MPQGHRLSGQSTYKRIFTEGKRCRSDWLGLVVAPNRLSYSRFGCTVRRSVFKTAVARNQMKRWLREAYKLQSSRVPKGWDLIVVVYRNPKETSLKIIEYKLCNLLKTINLQ